MLAGRLATLLLTAWGSPALTQGPSEHFAGVVTTWRTVRNRAGDTQRVIVTTPVGPVVARPTVFVVGWLSCSSVQIPPGGPGTDAALTMLERVIEETGMTVVRVEKPGLAGSTGRCGDTDFDTELSGYRAAFEAALEYPEVDTSRVVVLGSSAGGGIAPLVAGRHRVAGYVVIGAWARTWVEHMIGLERRRLALQGTPPDSIAGLMRRWISFHDLYLNQRRMPDEIVTCDPSLAGLWYDEPDHQYGRPLAYFQQLNALDHATAWHHVSAPVIAVRGEWDWIMSPEDVGPVIDTRRAGAGARRLVTMPRAGHALDVYPSAVAAYRGQGAVIDSAPFDSIVSYVKQLGFESHS